MCCASSPLIIKLTNDDQLELLANLLNMINYLILITIMI
jgi:hypothetical protein